MSNITFRTAIFVNFTNANKFLCHRVESSKSAASQEDQFEIMGNAPVKEVAQAAGTTSTTGEKPKCKACCACPETKKIRDQCIMERGEENCGTLIEAHKQCMRDLGFNV